MISAPVNATEATDDPVLSIEAMVRDNDGGVGTEATDDPVLPNEAMVHDDDGGISTEATDDPVLPNETMVRDNDSGIDKDVSGMLHDVGVLPELPEFPPVTEFDVLNGSVSVPPVNTIIQHNGGKRHTPLVARGAKSLLILRNPQEGCTAPSPYILVTCC